MNIEESIQQINELIEAWELNEACLNQTDIDAIKCLLKQNKELKQKYLNAVADYETTMAEKEQLKKQLKDKTEDYKRMKDNFDSKVDIITKIDTQQKEFIEWLEVMNRMYQNEYKDIDAAEHYNCVLQKYKSIIGDDK